LEYIIDLRMLLIALITGFVGMYILNPYRAREGGQFLVDSAVKILIVVRAGRRKDDPIKTTVEDRNGKQVTLIVPIPPNQSSNGSASPRVSGPLNARITDKPALNSPVEPDRGDKSPN